MNWKQTLPTRERVFAVLFTMLMVTSLFVGFISLGGGPLGIAVAKLVSGDFEDGTTGDWDGGTVVNDGYSGSRSLETSGTPRHNTNASVAAQDFVFEGITKPSPTSASYAELGVSVDNTSNSAYIQLYMNADGNVYIDTYDGSTGATSSTISYTVGSWYNYKLVGNGTTAKAKFWPAGTSEPDSWQMNVSHSMSFTGGPAHMYTASSGNIRLDEYTVGNSSDMVSSVSGTVTNESGSAISGATVDIEDDTGAVIESHTTDTNGEWNTSLSDGNYAAVVNATGYHTATDPFTVSGSAVTVNTTLGQDQVSGRVVSCPAANPKCANPSGVADGTVVQLYGVRESNLDSQDPAELREQAEDIRTEMRSFDSEQIGWDPDLALTGSNGEFRSTDHKYVAVHNPSDWALTGWTESPRLGNPLLSAPANEDIILSVWDPTSNSVIQDGVDSELPGAVDDDTDITVKQLDYSGDVVDTRTISTSSTRESLSPVASDHDYARVNLPPGFYLISAEGSPYSYVMTVGDPNDLTQTITDNLETESNQLSQQATEVQNYMEQDKVVKITTTTYSKNGEQGHWNASDVPTDVNVVAVQAFSPSAKEYQIDDVQNASIQDLREVAALDTYNGSFVITPRARDVQVPSSGNTIRAVEVDAAPFMDPDRFQNKSAWLQDLFQNSSFAGEMGEYLDTSDEDMAEIRGRLEQMKQENEALQSRYAELVEQALDEGESEDGLTNEEVTELIRQAIQELQGDLQPDDPTSGFENGNASATIPWDGDVDPDALSVTAHFPSLGISQPVPDEYVSVNKRTGRGDVVEVTDYPVPEGANAVTFGVTVSGEDGEGIGNTKVTTRNPNFTGDYLNLKSVEVSTIRPGPSEQVTVRPRTTEQSSVIDSVNATVSGPNGEVNATTTADGKAVQFTTDGPGSHRVLMHITDTDGNTWTDTIRLRADAEDVNQPPSVRVREGFTGTFAITSDGIIDGSVSSSGASFSASAIADAENVPSAVHFYGSEVSNKHTDVTLRVMKSSGGGEPESARKHVKVFYHTARLPEGTIIYRGSGQPLKVGGETRYGSVTCPEGEDGCTIQTYTEGSGSVDLTVIPHPSILDRTLHWVRLRSPVDLPSLTILPGLGGPLPGAGAMFGGVSS